LGKGCILVVDDDEVLQKLLDEFFSSRGYKVYSAVNCYEGRCQLAQEPIDVVLLDIMLVGVNGWECMTKFRQKHADLPVLILSSKNSEEDRIRGLEIGANDYLSKPFNLRELELRIENLLKISHYRKGGSEDEEKEIFLFDSEQECFTQNGICVKLTTMESRLLLYFLNNPATTLSRDDISLAIHGNTHRPMDRSLDVHINRLRSKIEYEPAKPKFLKTVWGKGYRFIANEQWQIKN